MNNKLFSILTFCIMCFSCSKHEITIDALSFEKDKIFVDDNRVELQLVNHSNQIFSLVSNNLDTINISENIVFIINYITTVLKK